MSPRTEHTNIRDLTYSKWHRTLERGCYAMNLDWIEYRRSPFEGLKIVALIEDKIDCDEMSLTDPNFPLKNNLPHWRATQMPIMLKIAKALDVPAYLVMHTACESNHFYMNWIFRVEDLRTGEVTTMDEPGYRSFIKSLGKVRT